MFKYYIELELGEALAWHTLKALGLRPSITKKMKRKEGRQGGREEGRRREGGE